MVWIRVKAVAWMKQKFRVLCKRNTEVMGLDGQLRLTVWRELERRSTSLILETLTTTDEMLEACKEKFTGALLQSLSLEAKAESSQVLRPREGMRAAERSVLETTVNRGIVVFVRQGSCVWRNTVSLL